MNAIDKKALLTEAVHVIESLLVCHEPAVYLDRKTQSEHLRDEADRLDKKESAIRKAKNMIATIKYELES